MQYDGDALCMIAHVLLYKDPSIAPCSMHHKTVDAASDISSSHTCNFCSRFNSCTRIIAARPAKTLKFYKVVPSYPSLPVAFAPPSSIHHFIVDFSRVSSDIIVTSSFSLLLRRRCGLSWLLRRRSRALPQPRRWTLWRGVAHLGLCAIVAVQHLPIRAESRW